MKDDVEDETQSQMSSSPTNPNTQTPRRGNPVSLLNRFAKRDPQLYPLFAIMLGTVGLGGYFLMYKAGKNAAEGPNRSFRNSSLFEVPSNPRRIVGGEWRTRNTSRHSRHDDADRSPFKKTRDQGSDVE